MKRARSKMTRTVLLWGLLVCLTVPAAEAAQLQKETSAAFDRYVSGSEGRMRSELHDGPYLFVDELPAERRGEAYAQLRQGIILVKQVNSEGHPIEVPGGFIHDWIGVVFIPNVTLAQTLSIDQDYDNYRNIYKPDVRESKLLKRDGDDFKVYLQFYKKSVITVVINAYFDITYERLGTDRVVSYSRSTRLAEVEALGQPQERELSADQGHAYLWRLNSYWRLEEKDGGVYVQLESIGLSRRVPAIFAWLVNPLLRSIPRGVFTSLLGANRAAATRP